MQTFMLKLDRVLRRHRLVVLALWVVAFAAALPFAAKQSDHLTGGGFGVPGSQSKAVEDRLGRDFPGSDRANLAAVLRPAQAASADDVRAALRRLDRAAEEVPDVALAERAEAQAARAAQARPDRPVVVPLAAAVPDRDAADVARDLREELRVGEVQGGVATHLVGQGALWAALQETAKEDVELAERRGFPIVAVVLLAVFGSLAAAVLPLALGAGAVIVTGALIYFLSLATEMSVFVTNMASMIGIGVAVDYSLFVLARYREEVRAGRPPDEARGVALATSGLAVVFSGLTVIASLAGLFLVNTTALRSMAIGAIVVVSMSMLAAATLLPVLISLLGRRAWAPSGFVGKLLALRRVRRNRDPHETFWGRWTAAVTRRPVVAVAGSAIALLALAAPALDLGTENGALRQLDEGHETRTGFEAAAQVTGRGDGTPVKVVVEGRGGADVAALRERIARDPAVQAVGRPIPAQRGDAALLLVRLDADGESPRAIAAVKRLREVAGEGVAVGGTTATLADFDDLVSGSLWKIVLFVLGLSYLVLLVLLRSAVLPLKAVAMNVLSVGAAYGVLALVFGDVDTIVPPLVLAVVFGLSMDYEVFLLTRIRERWLATGDTRRAIAEGLATSAKTITSAALIMVAVFLVFVGTGLPSIQQLGLGCAVAIALDATLVRLVLVPGAMELLGRWNWWLPRALDRVLPEASVEELATPPARPSPAATA
ncbi:MAG TPA: MMPL family transporter [Solirubrobacteraceae bacterium]|nr:MMPL family transporter [Solirubrobacteraceae bacterium]